MMRAKKLLSLFLSVAMALSLCTFGAWGDTASGAASTGTANVAQIGSTQYATLAEAVAAAQSGDTIRMLADTTLTATLAIDGKTFTLDLNGRTVTCAPVARTTAVNIGNNAASNITFEDTAGGGKITSSTLTEGYNLIANRSGSTVTLASGTYELTNVASTKVVQNQGTFKMTGGTITNSGARSKGIATFAGTVDVSGGTIDAAGTEANGMQVSDGTVTISGGTLTGNNGILQLGGTVTMNGTGKIDVAGTGVEVDGDISPSHNNPVTAAFTLENGSIEGGTASGTEAIGVFGLGASVTVNNGTVISDDNAAIMGNGTKNNSYDFGGYSITVNGGTITGKTTTANYGSCGIYHPNSGTLTVNGGTISGTTGAGIVVRGGNLTVNGGTISGNGTGGNSTRVGDATATYCGGIEIGYTTSTGTDYQGGIGAISITGGNISSQTSDSIKVFGTAAGSTHSKSSTITVSGGNFTADPTIYLADGYITANSTVSGYKYTVVAKPPVDVNVAAAVAAPEVKEAEASAAIPAAAVDAVNEAAKEVAVDKNNSESMAALTAAAADVVQDKVTETVAKQALTDVAALPANKETTVTAEDVTVLAQTYFAIEPKAAETNAGGKVTSVTLEIKPMCQLVATTNDVAKEASHNENAINTTSGDGQNAVKLGAPTPIEVIQPVTFTIGLPVSLVAEDSSSPTGYKPLTIKHVKENGDIYYYTATVTASELQSALSFYGTFTVTHGFSTFTLAAQDTHTMSVTYDAAGGTTTAANHTAYAVTDVGNALATAAKSGYTFDGWKFTYGQGGAITGATGTYKTLTDALWTAVTAGKDATVSVNATAQYSAIASSDSGTAAKYVITAKAGSNGTVTPAGDTSVASGSSKTYTIAPSTGYAVEDVTVDGESVGAVTTYTFRNIAASHLIEATFYPASWVNPFKDVAEKNWYFRAVRYVSANGLFDGISSDTFAPDEAMTRGMFVTVLWRLENKPVVNYAMNFTDVKENQWYAEAVRWAASEKIAKGYGDGTFRPSAPVQRQELAALLYRYAQYKGYDVSVGEDTNILSYDDAFTISEYAMPAIQWACGAGLMDGYGGNIHPRDNATRAQVAKIMMAFRENVKK